MRSDKTGLAVIFLVLTSGDGKLAGVQNVSSAERPDVLRGQGQERDRSTCGCDELDLERFAVRVPMYYRTNVAFLQPVLHHVALKDDGVQFINHVCLRVAHNG